MLFKPRISLGMSNKHVIHVVSVTSTELGTCYSCRLCHVECVTYILSISSILLGMTYPHVTHAVHITWSLMLLLRVSSQWKLSPDNQIKTEDRMTFT